MERLQALGRGTQLMFVASVLLLIISFLNWQEVEFDLGPLGEGSAGVSAWDNFLGIVMGILTIVLIARIVARMAAVDVPIPVSFAMTSVVLGLIIAICAILKNLTDDYSTFWSYIGVGLAVLIAIGAWLEVQDAGGVDSLKAEAGSYGSTTTAPASAPPPPPAAAAPAAAAPVTTEASLAGQESQESAASEASAVSPEASDTASDTTDAASDASSDEPSTEREH
jgi:hypothetical protein